MLRNYWQGLHGIIAATGNGSVGWTPHPLTQIILNLQARIRACLSVLDDDDLRQTMAEADAVTECMLADWFDFDIGWECGHALVASTCFVAVEKAWLDAGSVSFDLTMSEQMFIANVEAAVSSYRDSVDKEMKSCWRAAPVVRQQPRGGKSHRARLQSISRAWSWPAARCGSGVSGAIWRLVGKRDTVPLGPRRTQRDGGATGQGRKSERDLIHFLNPRPLRRS